MGVDVWHSRPNRSRRFESRVLGVDVLKFDVMGLPRSVYIKQADKRNDAVLLFFPCHTCMKIKTLAFYYS